MLSHRRRARSSSPSLVASFLFCAALLLLSADLPAAVALPSTSTISFPSLSDLSRTLCSRLASTFGTTTIPFLSSSQTVTTTTTTTTTNTITSKTNSPSSSSSPYDDINAPSAAASVVGHGFAEYDGTYDSSRVRRQVVLTSSSTLHPSSSSSSFSAARATHSALGFADFALTLKQHVAQPGGVHAFLNNVRLHFSATTSTAARTVYGRAAVTVVHSSVTLVPGSDKNREGGGGGGKWRRNGSRNEKLEFVPEALKNILSLPPKRVFALYGTHVVTGLVYGGELSLWGSVSADDNACYTRCIGSSTSSTTADADVDDEEEKDVVNRHHKCFDAAFDAYVQGFDYIMSSRRSNADCVDTAGLTTIGGHRLNSSFSAWVSSVPRNPRAIALSGAVPLWKLLRAHGYGEKAWVLQTFYHRHMMPRHAYVVKRFVGEWAQESGKPTASVTVPHGWKIVSGGVQMSERKGFGQLVTRSYPVTRSDIIKKVAAARRTGGGVLGGGERGNGDDEQTELPSVHDFVSSISHKVSNNTSTTNPQQKDESQQDTSGIVFWEVQAKDHLHIASGSVRAIAVALWDPADHYVVSVTRLTSSDAYRPHITVPAASAAEGYKLIGGGACVHWVQPGCLLTTSSPTHGDAGGWRAAASDHLVLSMGSITAFAVSLKRSDGDEVETMSMSRLSNQSVDTYAVMTTTGNDGHTEEEEEEEEEKEKKKDDGWWRFVSAGVDVVTSMHGEGEGGGGGGSGATAREKAFVTDVDVDEKGVSVSGQASSYVKEIKHRLRVSGVMLQGVMFVSRAGTVEHIGDDVDAL